MKLYLEEQTKTYWEAKAKKPCCDRMKMALRNRDVQLVFDNNKKGFARIEKWDSDDQILRIFKYCPWCGERIEMERKNETRYPQ